MTCCVLCSCHTMEALVLTDLEVITQHINVSVLILNRAWLKFGKQRPDVLVGRLHTQETCFEVLNQLHQFACKKVTCSQQMFVNIFRDSRFLKHILFVWIICGVCGLVFRRSNARAYSANVVHVHGSMCRQLSLLDAAAIRIAKAKI